MSSASGKCGTIRALKDYTVKHLDRLFVNVQRESLQLSSGRSTSNQNIPYFCATHLAEHCSRHGVYEVVPMYSSNMYSRITFLSAGKDNSSPGDRPKDGVRYSLTLHLFGTKNMSTGVYHTGILLLETNPADGDFYEEVYRLAFDTLHTDRIIYIVDCPIHMRFAATQLAQPFCVRSLLSPIQGVTEMEGHRGMSLQELQQIFHDLEEASTATLLSRVLTQSDKEKSRTSLLLIYVPAVDAFLDETYISSIESCIRQLVSETLVPNSIA